MVDTMVATQICHFGILRLTVPLGSSLFACCQITCQNVCQIERQVDRLPDKSVGKNAT